MNPYIMHIKKLNMTLTSQKLLLRDYRRKTYHYEHLRHMKHIIYSKIQNVRNDVLMAFSWE